MKPLEDWCRFTGAGLRLALLDVHKGPPVPHEQGNRLAAGEGVCRRLASRLARQSAAGILKTETTCAEAAKKVEREYAAITDGERSPKWVEGHSIRLLLFCQSVAAL